MSIKLKNLATDVGSCQSLEHVTTAVAVVCLGRAQFALQTPLVHEAVTLARTHQSPRVDTAAAVTYPTQRTAASRLLTQRPQS